MASDVPSLQSLPDRLPRLRRDLDVMPSPVAEQPGLLVRDPYRYSDDTLIIPTTVVPLLRLLDGAHSGAELRAATERVVGLHDADDVARDLLSTLSEAGFLEDQAFTRRRGEAERAFAQAPTRLPAHAGQGYPDDVGELESTIDRYLDEGRRALLSGPRTPRTEAQRLIGIAAPHVSPFGGSEIYGAAYFDLPPSLADRTFVILGTSHYGEPDKFGLTRKTFTTPLGETATDLALVGALERGAPRAVVSEDYCHLFEHSLEFQIIFLQRLFGPRIKVAPVLCGPFSSGAQSLPDRDDAVHAFIDTLGEQVAGREKELFFVLGVDMAHVGRRYGDRTRAQAHRGTMTEVAERDAARLGCLARGEGEAFWTALHEKGEDDLRWCGASPLYTFARALPSARSRLLRYGQWNIDEASVVSFAALRFTSGAETSST